MISEKSNSGEVKRYLKEKVIEIIPKDDVIKRKIILEMR